MATKPLSPKNCDFMIVFVVPNDHRFARAPFAHYDDAYRAVDKGESSVEEIDKDISDVSVDVLRDKLVREDMRISWACKKPGDERTRIYLLFSHREAYPMSEDLQKMVGEIISQTWQWGRYKAIWNEKGPDLVIIDVIGRAKHVVARHFFDLGDDGEIEVCQNTLRKPSRRELKRQSGSNHAAPAAANTK